MVSTPRTLIARTGVSVVGTAVAIALIAVGLLLGQQVAAPVTADAATRTTTSTQHPFSDPEWFPLRTPAAIGCSKTACGAYKGHGYWAIDWTGRQGDGVYAAGAGILHIGGRASSCVPKGGPEVEGGNWVWIDHGAGVVSRYHHLDTIDAREGQLVTPATKIGTMGHSGDFEPCTINYLHFEVRHGGLKGKRVDFGPLKACTADGVVSLPAALGAQSWDDPKIHTRPRIKTPAATSSCISPTWLQTAKQPTVSLARASKALTVRWNAPPAGTTAAVLKVEIYRPSQGRFDHLKYVSVAARPMAYRLTKLDNGRTYRISVSFRNEHGHSAYSGQRKAVPAGAPGAPKSPRYLTWPKRDYVHYGWYRPAHNGSPVTSFTVAARCSSKGSGYGAWKLYPQRVKDAYLNVRGLSTKTTCQVKVRGNNAVGAGTWSRTSKISWRG